MAKKDEKIQFRIDEGLKARYLKALTSQDFPEGITDHLTKYIIETVKKHETRLDKKKAATSR